MRNVEYLIDSPLKWVLSSMKLSLDINISLGFMKILILSISNIEKSIPFDSHQSMLHQPCLHAHKIKKIKFIKKKGSESTNMFTRSVKWINSHW